MNYADLNFKIPVESPDYKAESEFVTKQITDILNCRKNNGDDKIDN